MPVQNPQVRSEPQVEGQYVRPFLESEPYVDWQSVFDEHEMPLHRLPHVEHVATHVRPGSQSPSPLQSFSQFGYQQLLPLSPPPLLPLVPLLPPLELDVDAGHIGTGATTAAEVSEHDVTRAFESPAMPGMDSHVGEATARQMHRGA